MVMRSLDKPPPIIISLSKREDLSYLTASDSANTLPSNLRFSNPPTTEREDSRNLIGSDHVDTMRGHGIGNALTTTASGGRILRSPDRSSANHLSYLSFLRCGLGLIPHGAYLPRRYSVIGTPYHGGLTVRRKP